MQPQERDNMTTREMFEVIKSGLLRQRKVSRNEEAACRYRSPGGLKCAVGFLIKDEQYDETIEGWTVRNLTSKTTPPAKAVERSIGRSLHPHELEMLSEVQRMHDRTPEGEESSWEEKFDELEKKFFELTDEKTAS